MQKTRDLFKYIRTRKYNIACLQDVHIDIDMLSYVKSEHRRSTFGPSFLFYHYLFFSFSHVL